MEEIQDRVLVSCATLTAEKYPSASAFAVLALDLPIVMRTQEGCRHKLSVTRRDDLMYISPRLNAEGDPSRSLQPYYKDKEMFKLSPGFVFAVTAANISQ